MIGASIGHGKELGCFSYKVVSVRLPGVASLLWLGQTPSQAPQLCGRQRGVSSSKWHRLLCQQQPVQLHASLEGGCSRIEYISTWPV